MAFKNFFNSAIVLDILNSQKVNFLSTFSGLPTKFLGLIKGFNMSEVSGQVG